MEFKEGPLRATLSTKGRKTGRDHMVELRAVFYDGKFYFSRRNPDSDWLKNAIANPKVSLEVGGRSLVGSAQLVMDAESARKISKIKYADRRSEDSRIVLEVRPCE